MMSPTGFTANKKKNLISSFCMLIVSSGSSNIFQEQQRCQFPNTFFGLFSCTDLSNKSNEVGKPAACLSNLVILGVGAKACLSNRRHAACRSRRLSLESGGR